MPALRLDITIEQGADFDLVVNVVDDVFDSDGNVTGETPSDLTGWTARMQARERVDSTTTLFDITPTVASSAVTIHIGATATAAYDWLSGVYDLEITDGTVVRRLLRGNVTVNREVTR